MTAQPSAAASTANPTPKIAGTVQVGRTLTVKPGTWRPTARLSYQWYVSGSKVRGATKARWVVTPASAGKRVTVRVVGRRPGHAAVIRTSKPTTKVARGVFSAPTPTISGTVQVGRTVSATAGTWKPRARLSYQWFANGSKLAGATSRTLVVPPGAAGRKLQVKVTGAAAGYVSTTRTSASTAATRLGVLSPTPTPTISGSAVEGATLTATVGTWGPAGTAVALAWLRDGTPIPGATAATHVVGPADVGHRLAVRATGTRTGYAAASRTSATVSVTRPASCVHAEVAQVPDVIATDTTWSTDCAAVYMTGAGVTVAPRVTLTIEPGVVVKGALEIGEGATVRAHGTAQAPVVFTDPRDDSAGGDSNEDGDESAPEADAYAERFILGDHANVDLSHVRVESETRVFLRYLPFEISSIVIRDSELNADVQLADLAQPPVIERTTIRAHHAGLVLSSAPADRIALSGPDRITLVGSPLQRSIIGASWSAGDPMTLNHESGVSAFVGIETNRALTLEPGVVVKGVVTVLKDGALSAAGTAARPVIFTDVADDAFGGDTDGEDAVPDRTSGHHRFRVDRGAVLSLSHARVLQASRLFEGWLDATGVTVEIRDSELHAEVTLSGGIERPVIERTTIASPTTGPLSGLTLIDVPDVTGVAISGPDHITLVGNASQRVLQYTGRCGFCASGLPPGSDWRLTRDSGMSAFVGHLEAYGSVTVDPGVVVKGLIDVKPGGVIHAEGTAEEPVVFTDWRDDSWGGDSNGDGDESAPGMDGAAPGALLSVTGGATSTIDHVLFEHADTALRVGELTLLSVTNSKFVNTRMAIDVAPAGSADQGTGYFYGTLPCAPPYDSLVEVHDTWFGSHGLPGISADAMQLVGILAPPVIGDDDMSFVFQQMTSQLSVRTPLGGNATPWSLYSCSGGPEGTDVVGFPVTPVIIAPPVPSEEWLPGLGELG